MTTQLRLTDAVIQEAFAVEMERKKHGEGLTPDIANLLYAWFYRGIRWREAFGREQAQIDTDIEGCFLDEQS